MIKRALLKDIDDVLRGIDDVLVAAGAVQTRQRVDNLFAHPDLDESALTVEVNHNGFSEFRYEGRRYEAKRYPYCTCSRSPFTPHYGLKCYPLTTKDSLALGEGQGYVVYGYENTEKNIEAARYQLSITGECILARRPFHYPPTCVICGPQ
jgi:hypothetical protein